MNSKLKAIFFDVGNTLLFPNRERIHVPLGELGIVPDADHLRDLECRTKNRFDASSVDGRSRRIPRQGRAASGIARRTSPVSINRRYNSPGNVLQVKAAMIARY